MEEAGRSEEGVSSGVASRVKGNISYSRILGGIVGWGIFQVHPSPTAQVPVSLRKQTMDTSGLFLPGVDRNKTDKGPGKEGKAWVPQSPLSVGLGDLTRSRKVL